MEGFARLIWSVAGVLLVILIANVIIPEMHVTWGPAPVVEHVAPVARVVQEPIREVAEAAEPEEVDEPQRPQPPRRGPLQEGYLTGEGVQHCVHIDFPSVPRTMSRHNVEVMTTQVMDKICSADEADRPDLMDGVARTPFGEVRYHATPKQ